MSDVPAGWRDNSNLATFRIGDSGVWTTTITWQPGPDWREETGRYYSRERMACYELPTTEH